MPARRNRQVQPIKRWLSIGVLLLAFALRAWRLGDQNIWWDEGYSVYLARHGLGALTTLAAGDTHPPLYYWLLHAWMGWGGQTEFALRFPSLLFGVLTVALVYRLGHCLATNEPGRPASAAWIPTLAALLLAINRFHVWWSQEIRMYSLATLWTAASMGALLQFGDRISASGAERHPLSASRRSSAWLYALTVCAGLYSLYLFIFVVAAQAMFAVWLAWRQRKAGSWKPLLAGWGGAMLAAALALLPWLLYSLPRLKSWSAASEFGPLTYLRLAWTVLTLGQTEYVENYWPANLVFAAILVAGTTAWFTRPSAARPSPSAFILHPSSFILPPSAFILAALVLCVPVAGVFVLLTLPPGLRLAYSPPLEARYQLLSAPALALLLAASLAALWTRRQALGALAGAAAAAWMLWSLPGYYAGRHLRDDFQTMTRAIQAYAEPGDALVLVAGDRFPLFNFRYDLLPRRAELPDVTTLSVRRVTPDDVESVLAPLAQAHGRVWLAEVEKNLQDPDDLLARWLDANRRVVWREMYGYNRLTLYSPSPAPPTVVHSTGEHPQQAGLGGASLLGYDLPVREAWPGDVAPMVAYLQVDEPLTLTTALVTFDDSDVRVLEERQDQLAPGRGPARVRLDAPVYARTPPGEYRFVLSSPQQSVLLDARLRIAGTPPPEPAGAISNPRDVRLGDGVHLVGYQAPAAVQPGGQAPVTLYWRASRKIRERYTVFVQLVGTQFNPSTNGPLWAGHDGEPLDGGYPTTQWFVYKTIADTHTLTIPHETPPGEYELWVGMYTQPDVTRLPVYDDRGNPVGDHAVLSKVMVKTLLRMALSP